MERHVKSRLVTLLFVAASRKLRFPGFSMTRRWQRTKLRQTQRLRRLLRGNVSTLPGIEKASSERLRNLRFFAIKKLYSSSTQKKDRFGEGGRLHQSASHDMKSTLLRYDSMNGRIMERLCSSSDSEQSSSLQYYEVGKEMLARKIISLEKSQRNITGEDLDSLTLEELNYLEKKMDRAVRRITRQKLRAMWDEIRLLKGQVRSLEEENKKFRTMVQTSQSVISFS